MSLFSNLKSDLPASVVVFFVAVPLCLGIALASGAPLIAGLIAGIVGGLIVGMISGSPLGVRLIVVRLVGVERGVLLLLGGDSPLGVVNLWPPVEATVTGDPHSPHWVRKAWAEANRVVREELCNG